MPKAEVNGVALNYRIDGPDGAPWLTFSNSLAADMTMWDPQIGALADRFRVLRYDTRGHGDSSGPAGDYSFDDLVGDVVGLWDALDIARSRFVGLSLGGMTGLGLMLDHPSRVERAVICDCRADAPEFFVNMWIERRAALAENGIEAVVEGNLERWFTDAYRAQNPPLLDDVRAMIRRTSNAGFVGCTGALMTLDYMRRIDAITTPTLFVVGAQDGPHPDVMRTMHAAVPGSTLAVIDDAAHLPNLEQPDAFNAAIAAFLDAER